MITIEELQKELFYDKDDGNFYWVNPKPGRPTDKPAGTVSHQGYTIITISGIKYQASRLIWFYMTGEWPTGQVGYRDNDPHNTKWDNLKLVSNTERTINFRNSINEPDKPTTSVIIKKVRRAQFSNSDVTKAVEEFIKDKILVEGWYVRNLDSQASTETGVSPQAS